MHFAFPPLLAHVCTWARPPCHPSPNLQGCCIALPLTQKKGKEYHFSLSLFLPLVAFFGTSTTATSTFLLSCFQGCLEALVVCEIEPMEGFFTNMLILLDASTSLVKLKIYRFFKYGQYSYSMPVMQMSTNLSSSTRS